MAIPEAWVTSPQGDEPISSAPDVGYICLFPQQPIRLELARPHEIDECPERRGDKSSA